MTYQPNIPTGTVNLDVDYQNLRGNFQQADTVFNSDHTLLSNATPQKGYHTSIHMIPQAAPTNTPGYGQVYSNTVNDGINTDQSLYFQTGTGNRNLLLTRNFTPTVAANGATFLPGGLIMQWGSSTAVLNSSNTTITFPMAFPNAVYSVQVTVVTSNNSTIRLSLQGVATLVDFTTTQTNSPNFIRMYWMAIGN